MSFINIITIAIALAMDAFAVSVSVGAFLKNINFRQFFRLSWHFGFFQAMMPVIGWSTGLTVRGLVERFDHWIAFCILAFVGTNMMREAFKKKDDSTVKDPTKGYNLILLSIATSIDALAVGFSFSILNISIWLPAVFIGFIALLFTGSGLYIGSKTTHISWGRKYAGILGAIVLYMIGLKILYEHDVFSFL